MTKLSQQDAAKTLRSEKILWLSDNNGVLTRIAEEFGVTQPFISDVFHGRRKSKDGVVENKLAELKAPGF